MAAILQSEERIDEAGDEYTGPLARAATADAALLAEYYSS